MVQWAKHTSYRIDTMVKKERPLSRKIWRRKKINQSVMNGGTRGAKHNEMEKEKKKRRRMNGPSMDRFKEKWLFMVLLLPIIEK